MNSKNPGAKEWGGTAGGQLKWIRREIKRLLVMKYIVYRIGNGLLIGMGIRNVIFGQAIVLGRVTVFENSNWCSAYD